MRRALLTLGALALLLAGCGGQTASIEASAIPTPRLGESPPLEIVATGRPSERTGVPCRGKAFPASQDEHHLARYGHG